MAYTYGHPSEYNNPNQFKGPAEDYPTLELPIARFIRPEDAEYYQGSSALTNFILRRAIDSVPKSGRSSVPTRLAERNLWITASFKDERPLGLHVDLQVHPTGLWLSAGRGMSKHGVHWTRQSDGAYLPDRVKEENRVLSLPGEQEPLEVELRTYQTLPTHNQYQTNAALRFDTVFGGYEIALRFAPTIMGNLTIRALSKV